MESSERVYHPLLPILTSIRNELQTMRKEAMDHYLKWDEYTKETTEELEATKQFRKQFSRMQESQQKMIDTIRPEDIQEMAKAINSIPNKEKIAELGMKYLQDKHKEDDEFKKIMNRHSKPDNDRDRVEDKE